MSLWFFKDKQSWVFEKRLTALINLNLPDILIHGLETVWIEINFPNKSKLLVSSLYRPSNVDLNNFIPNLEKTLDVASSKGDEILLLGDLSYDLSPKKLPHDTKEVIKLFNIYQFSQLIEDKNHWNIKNFNWRGIYNQHWQNCYFWRFKLFY